MSCEIFEQLKLCGFTKARSCVYESTCPFANIKPVEIEEVDVATQCAAALDEQSGSAIEARDLLQEQELKTLICNSRLN